jgi:RNA polymerase sigma-70 factor, ECF subfamily
MTTITVDSHEDLLPRLRVGDDEAFSKFVRGNSGRLLAVARRMLRDEHAAADAVQEGFLSAFKSLGQFAGNSSLETWLHRIVVNVCLMKLRSRSRRQEMLMEDLLPKFDRSGHHAEPISRWSGPSEELLQRDEVRAQIRESIDRLPDEYRDIVLLRDIEGLDTDETAELLHVSTSVVKTRLHRARQALRTLLEPILRG